MGDPHVSPFYSICTQVVGTQDGIFDLWSVPGKISFQVDVQSDAGRHWVKKLIVDGQVVMDADTECYSDKFVYNTVTISDDMGGLVDVYYDVSCREQSESKGAKQLIVNIRLRDEHDTLVDPNPSGLMPIDSTFMFKGDTGMCVDPPKYGQNIPDPTQNDYKLACNRQSEFKYTSGRYCNCSASCGAWGDPHLMDFYVNQCRSSQRCNFLTPITAEIQYNMMYQAQQTYAFQTALDDTCHLISEGIVYAMNARSMKKLNGCSPESGALAMGDLAMVQDNTFKTSDWDRIRLVAEDVCSKFGKDATTFTVPSDPSVSTGIPELDQFNKDHYDPDVRGFNLGQQVLVWKDGRQYLVPVTGGYSTCLKKKGFDPAEATKLVKFGGVTSTLVCHQNKKGMWYFNACSNKQSMVVQDFVMDGKALEKASQLPKVAPSWGDAMIATLEQAAFTGGFCATGNFEAKQNIAVQTSVTANAYAYRTSGNTREFVPANRFAEQS
jgi:hypothetical protein